MKPLHDSETQKISASGCGLYIHIVYCRKKCIYCDFFSAGQRIADWHRYTDALINELKHRKDETACPFETIYIGGGTPSLMPEEEFTRLAEAIRPFTGKVSEFTIEVNPEDVTVEKLELWKRGGVDRISMGVQSFNDNLLKIIGRGHNADASRKAYKLARQYFDHISIDLMFGLPQQTLSMWKNDVDEAVKLRPEHLSAYSLMYEPGTALTVMRDNRRVEEAKEELSEEMFRFLIDALQKAGYEHYEISNFALPGFRSRHNSSYWRQTPYIGLGPSAHSYDGMRTRKANRADLRGYIDHWASLQDQSFSTREITDEEYLSGEELLEEYIMTRMRTREGIPLDDFKERFGQKAFEKLMEKSTPLLNRGSLISDSKRLSLHESAILISDSIIVDLL